jgi:tetratricopeptide (TPR) repeat protein
MPPMATLTGELAQGILPGVLRTLYVERRTGLLTVTRQAEQGSVCFIRGNIVYGSTTIKECQLGETLVRHGILRQQDRERAGAMVSATGQRLGQILLDLGLLDADGLEDALALQVREVLLTVFSWPDGHYVFDDQDAARFRGYDKPLRVSTGEVILDAVWSISDPDVLRFALGDLDRVLAPASDPLLRFQRISFSPTDGFILSRVDGVLSAREILALAPVTAAEAERSLCGLLYTGMVEFVKVAPDAGAPAPPALGRTIRAAHAALAHQNHFEVLGVTPAATASELLAAYFRLARIYHPDQHHLRELHDQKDVLEALFRRVGEAHRVLSDPHGRAAYELSLAPPSPPRVDEPAPVPAPPEILTLADPMQIAEALDRADEMLAAGRAWDAGLAVEAVLAQATGRVRRRGRLLKARAHLQGPGGARAAEEELKAALAEDAAHPEAHFLLGTIYRDGGAHALAAAAFRRALALKPRYHDAQAALSALVPVTGQEAGGALRRLIGR